jgi:pimeloyl-ACP methyl ester carboxylesterase
VAGIAVPFAKTRQPPILRKAPPARNHGIAIHVRIAAPVALLGEGRHGACPFETHTNGTPMHPATPVLALHSSMSSRSQWRALSATLESRRHVVAVNLHGYGGNPLPPEGRAFAIEDEVDLVVERAGRALGCAQPMHVVGHSYGGAVALALARLRPNLVRSLTLFEPVCFNLLGDSLYRHTVQLVAERISTFIGRGEPSRAAREFMDYWGGYGSYDAHSHEERQRFDGIVAKVPLDFAAASAGPPVAAYAEIAAPMLLMVGRSSLESVRTIAKALWAVMPRSHLEEIPGDHLLPIRNPSAFNREVAAFLDTFEDEVRFARTGSGY